MSRASDPRCAAPGAGAGGGCGPGFGGTPRRGLPLRLAQQQGKTRSACIREAIQQYLLRHGDSEEARRQSEHLGQLEQPNWSEQVPGWSDWTA